MIVGSSYMAFSGRRRGISLYQTIQGLGLGTNLKLCLDAGDRDSYVGGTLTTTAGPSTPAVQGANWNGYTLRQVIAAAQISTSGSQVVVSFAGDGAGSFAITKAYIGHQGAGDAYDFAATPVQLTFGGNAGFTIDGAASISSDVATFALDETQNLVISFYVPSSATDDFASQTTLTGWSLYYLLGADDSATVNASGYTNYTATQNVAGVLQVDVVATGDGGQKWTDRTASAAHFVRGVRGVSDSADPTFNGNIGGLSLNEYWTSDAGDYFTIASRATPSWAQPFHKNNATFTIMAAAYHTSGTTGITLFEDWSPNPTETGITWRMCDAGTRHLAFQCLNAGASVLNSVSAGNVNNDAWNIIGLSLDEAVGAAGGVHFTNGAGGDSFTSTYSSPSASDTAGSLSIGLHSAAAAFAANERIAWLAAWDTALGPGGMNTLFQAMRTRHNI